jgi:hypothetical protein
LDNRTEKLIQGSEAIVADTFCLAFLKESETAVREVARSKGRSYKSILSALNDGMAIKDLRQAFNRARKSAMWAAASADTTKSSNRLKEEGLTCPPGMFPFSKLGFGTRAKGIACRESVTPQSRSSDTFVRQRYGPVRAKRSLRPFVSLALTCPHLCIHIQS